MQQKPTLLNNTTDKNCKFKGFNLHLELPKESSRNSSNFIANYIP